MKSLAQFQNLYALQKTLRFELKPEGHTRETFNRWLEEIEKEQASENENIVYQDLLRAKKYEKIKIILDEYHKDFIEQALAYANLTELEKYEELYRKSNRTSEEEEEFENTKESLRKQISNIFIKNPNKTVQERWKSLFSKELIQNELIVWVIGNYELLSEKLKNEFPDESSIISTIKDFKDFTTYFRNYHENRKNLYSNEDKFSTIAHRLIHENLPKFIDNITIYQKAKAVLNINEVEKELGLPEDTLDKIFSLDFFSKALTQKGIDQYNYVLGGKTENEVKKIKGLNEFINLYNQQQQDKNQRLPFLKVLYKLPLFERTTTSFRFEPIENDRDLIERIGKFYYNDLKQYRDDSQGDTTDILSGIKTLLRHVHDYRDGLYINGGITLTQISQKIFGSWSYINNALAYFYDTYIDASGVDHQGERKPKKQKQIQERTKWLKQKQFPVILVEKALSEYKSIETNEDLKTRISDTTLCDFFKRCGIDDNGQDLFDRIEARLREKNEEGYSLEDLLKKEFTTERKLMQDKPKTLLIKNFLDVIQGDKDDITAGLLHFVKCLIPRTEISEKNELFYSGMEKYLNILSEVTPLYNKARNYLTQKPYSIEKVKLNFENSTLLDGWDENKESDNSCVLLRKRGYYYLGIMNKKHNMIFDRKIYPKATEGEAYYEKMIYKLLPGANKMLPKVFFSEKNIDYFKPSEEILRIRNTASYSKNGQPQEGYQKASFSIEDCRKYIDFFKKCIANHWDWQKFNFNFSPTESYQSIDEFYREIERQGYKIDFVKIPESYINQLIKENKLYLFKIYNKDFSEKKKSKGKDNLHTLYWKMLFDEKNLKDVVLKLNGEAEVFFRQKSILYNEEIWNKGHHYSELKDRFSYPIISNKRYAEDKFFLHVPITLNFKADGINNVNNMVNEFIKDNRDIHIIGIDRGERHLLYVSVINQKGDIVEQCSLNEIVTEYNGKIFRKNYHEELDKLEKERDRARKDWQTIANIKELKEGYLSHVIHKISKLILKYNAIVMMEDLNSCFKRGRQKVEKQVYQNFEKQLIEKLNYLVLKESNVDEPGGVLRAYQLANKFETFKKLGKQSGIIFYVPAAYTSAIDPVTGYIQYLYPLKQADSVEKARKFYSQFKRISYNLHKQWFEFSFDYNDFNIIYHGKSSWTICTTNTERYMWNRLLNNGHGGEELVYVTNELELLFGEYNIIYGDGKDIKQQIIEVQDIDVDRTAKQFYKRLNELLNLTLKLRHNNGKKGADEEDYILSPVEPYFDSRFESRKPSMQQTLPINADANGAFNIARKGLLLLERLNQLGVEEFKKTKKSNNKKTQWLPHELWVEYAQNHTRK